MTIVQHGKGLECTAYGTSGCVFCGTRIYSEQKFWQPVIGDLQACVANLVARVAAWRSEPVCCGRCPVAVAS